MNGKTIPSRIVFLSSTTSDLMHYRVVAQRVIDTLNDEFNGIFSLTGSSMISKTQDGITETKDGERCIAITVSRDWVREADWIIFIVGWNYGFVPEVPNGKPLEPWEPCSITEWEYWEATKLSTPPKKCFVFLAGEFGDGPDFEYRALDKKTEPVNLMSFLTSKYSDKLASFRSTLRGGRFALFKDVEHFKELLTKTLRSKIQKDLSPSNGLNLESVLMITGLLTPVRIYIDAVTTLATLKRLHDRLHKIRQWGIRRWREEVLARWQEDNEIPVGAELIYLNGKNTVYKMIGEIDGYFKSLEPGLQTLLHSIPRVVTHFDVGDNSVPLRRQAFERSIDLFARRVQAAFTACNWQMMQADLRLRACEKIKKTPLLCHRNTHHKRYKQHTRTQ